MTRAERLLAIMQFLRARRGPITAADIAASFGVSERTIYRDIGVLVARGAAIRGDAGFGYTLDPGHFLPPLMFTADEAHAISFGLRYVMRRGDSMLAEAALDALAKIAAILPADLDHSIRMNGLAVQPENHDIQNQIAHIRAAIGSERKLRFDYVDRLGVSSARVVSPVAIGFFDAGAMLAAWCDDRCAFRHFRLERMLSLALLDDRFTQAHRTYLADYKRLEPGMES